MSRNSTATAPGKNSLDRLTVKDVVALAHTLYSSARSGVKYKQMLRPYICPIHKLVEYVPFDASLLDVGCGGGLFISVLARLDRIRSATGFDADQAAIGIAQSVAAKLPGAQRLRFEHRDVDENWPAGCFDVVCLIDVMHHIQPHQQAELLATAAKHVADGGILLYKDMARRPRWRAIANRLHDLLFARQWIYYAKLDDVIDWGRKAGLQLEETKTINMLWYAHEWCIFRRMDKKKI